MTDLPYSADGDGVRLRVRVTPRARRTALAGIVTGADGRPALAVRLAAPPVEGAANEALLRLLAAAFGIARSSVRIVAGGTARAKTVRLAGLAPETLEQRLADALAP